MDELIKRSITGSILIFLIYTLLLVNINYIFSIFMLLILSLILILECPKIYDYKNKYSWLLTLIYPIMPFVLIIIMHQTGYKILNIILFTLAFANDTGSYIFGKLFGTSKILPKISPGKTWQGFFGGYLFTTLTLYFFYLYPLAPFPAFAKDSADNATNLKVINILLLSLIISGIALLGDLFESYLKRRVGIKNSSEILPGHGGLLDRFDSIMFLAILFFIFKNYFINLF